MNGFARRHFVYYEVEFVYGPKGKNACGLYQITVIVIGGTLDCSIINRLDEFIELVIIPREFLQQTILILQINRGQFKN